MQTIKLTPYDSSLIGKYIPNNDVCVLIDTSAAGFTVTLPDAYSTEKTKYEFSNIGSNEAILVTVVGQFIKTLPSITLDPHKKIVVTAYHGTYYVLSIDNPVFSSQDIDGHISVGLEDPRAYGNGNRTGTNIALACAAAATSGGIVVLSGGNYAVNTAGLDFLSVPIQVMPGCHMIISSGCAPANLKIYGDPDYQVIELLDDEDMLDIKNDILRIEWIGAQRGTEDELPVVDCSPFLQICVNAQALSRKPICLRHGVYLQNESVTVSRTGAQVFYIKGENKGRNHSTLLYSRNINGYSFIWNTSITGSTFVWIEGISFDGSNGNRNGVMTNWSTTWLGAYSNGNYVSGGRFIINCWIGCALHYNAVAIDFTNVYYSEVRETYIQYFGLGRGINYSVSGSVGTTNSVYKCYFNAVRECIYHAQQLNISFSHVVFESSITAICGQFSSSKLDECHFEHMGYDITGSVLLTDNSGTLIAGDVVSITVDGIEYSQTYSVDKTTTLQLLAIKVIESSSVIACRHDDTCREFIITPVTQGAITVTYDLSGVHGTFAWTQTGLFTGKSKKLFTGYPNDTVIHDHTGRFTAIGGKFFSIMPNSLKGWFEGSGIGASYGYNGTATFYQCSRGNVTADYSQPFFYNDTRIVGGGVENRAGYSYIVYDGKEYTNTSICKIYSDIRKLDIGVVSLRLDEKSAMHLVNVKAGKIAVGTDWTRNTFTNYDERVRKNIVDWDDTVKNWQIGDICLRSPVLNGKNTKWVCVVEGLDPPLWEAGVKTLGATCVPNSYQVRTYYYTVTTAGNSASTEPTWPTTIGATVTDGTVVWECTGTPSVWQTDHPLVEEEPAYYKFVGTTNRHVELVGDTVITNREVHRWRIIISSNNILYGNFDVTVMYDDSGTYGLVDGVTDYYGLVEISVVSFSGRYKIKLTNHGLSSIKAIVHRDDTTPRWRY